MHNIIIRGGKKENSYELVNYLKAFSILTIVIMHLIQNFIDEVPLIIFNASSIGGAGVHVFLVCSGFGLYYSYLRHGSTFMQFIKRRFIKIFIPYIVVVFVSALLPYMYNGTHRTTALLSHIFLFKMFFPQYEESFGTQLWYMSTIIQFYIAFIPLCKLKSKIGSKKFLISALIISFLWWILVVALGFESERIWNSFFLQYLWEFAFGMCVADYLYRGHDISIKPLILIPLSILGLAATYLTANLGTLFRVFNDVPSLLGYGGIALLIYSLNVFDVAKKILLKLSNFSYEWYLLHMLVFTTIFHFFNTNSILFQIVIGCIAFILSLLFSYGYHILIGRVSVTAREK